MLPYLLKRVAVAVPTLLALIVVSYVLMYAAPGGPFDTERALPPEVMANLERKYGLDRAARRADRALRRLDRDRVRFRPLVPLHRTRSVNEIIRAGVPGDPHLRGLVLRGRGPRRGLASASRPRCATTRCSTTSRSGSPIGAQVLPELRPGPDPHPRLHPLARLAAGGRVAGRRMAVPQ